MFILGLIIGNIVEGDFFLRPLIIFNYFSYIIFDRHNNFVYLWRKTNCLHNILVFIISLMLLSFELIAFKLSYNYYI